MRVILPVLYGQEFEKVFLTNLSRDADVAVVLGILDTDKMSSASGSEIANISEVEKKVDVVEDFLIRKGIDTKGIVQWGEMERIIINNAKRYNADKVILVFSQAEFFPALVRTLKKSLECTLEVV